MRGGETGSPQEKSSKKKIELNMGKGGKKRPWQKKKNYKAHLSGGQLGVREHFLGTGNKRAGDKVWGGGPGNPSICGEEGDGKNWGKTKHRTFDREPGARKTDCDNP